MALFTSLKKSIGVEINKQFAGLSSSLISKYGFADRVTIVNDDIVNCVEYIQQGKGLSKDKFSWTRDNCY